MKKFAIIIALLLAISSFSFGQEKRLSKKKVASPIHAYLQTHYPAATKIKFYEEKTGEKKFIESVFWHNGKKYALKFLNDSLVETEIFIAFQEIPMPARGTIKQVLDSLFTNYKILHSQEVRASTEETSFEIYIKGRSRQSKGHFEVFFDQTGKLLRQEEKLTKPIHSQF